MLGIGAKGKKMTERCPYGKTEREHEQRTREIEAAEQGEVGWQQTLSHHFQQKGRKRTDSGSL